MLRTAETILVHEGLPEDHVLFNDIDDILGVICDHSGALCRSEALRRRLRAVKIRSKIFASTPPAKTTLQDKLNLYNAHANLACTYNHDENFDEANRIMEDCLEQYRSWGTEDELPFEYSKYYHHSAIAVMAQGRVRWGGRLPCWRSVLLRINGPSAAGTRRRSICIASWRGC